MRCIELTIFIISSSSSSSSSSVPEQPEPGNLYVEASPLQIAHQWQAASDGIGCRHAAHLKNKTRVNLGKRKIITGVKGALCA